MDADEIRADVGRARELDAATTKGPWEVAPCNAIAAVYVHGPWRDDSPPVPGLLRCNPPVIVARADGEFIAESRTLLPRLAAHCETLLAENESLRQRVAELRVALNPFAETGKYAVEDGEPDGDFVSLALRRCPTVGDCRRAAALLAESEGKS